MASPRCGFHFSDVGLGFRSGKELFFTPLPVADNCPATGRMFILYIIHVSSPMSSLFLTELPPISLCAHHLVLTFRTTAGYYTHVSELSS